MVKFTAKIGQLCNPSACVVASRSAFAAVWAAGARSLETLRVDHHLSHFEIAKDYGEQPGHRDHPQEIQDR